MDGPSTSKSSPATSADDENGEFADRQPEKIETPIEIFADKVSIAGLSESYKETHKPTRYMYRLALILTFVAIIHQTYMIGVRYQGVNTVFMDEEVLDEAPFPNITICFPPNVDFLYFPEFLDQSKSPKISRLMAQNHLTIADIQNFLTQTFMLNVKGKDFGTPIYLAAAALFDAVQKVLSDEGRSIITSRIPRCEDILSNCSFNGRRFNCCDAAQYVTILHSDCFQLNTAAIEHAIPDMDTDPMHLDQVGMTVHVKIDWTNGLFIDGSASDGYHVFVGIEACPFRVPLHVPSDSDVQIVLAQPRRLSEITHCSDSYKKFRLKYFQYYDPNGMNCVAEATIDLLEKFIGCTIPVLSYVPANATCTSSQVFIGAAILSDALDYLNNDMGERLKAKGADVYKTVRDLHSDKSTCLPMCNRWAYRAFSASFGSIAYKDKEEETHQMANASWSRIRVIMPHISHMRHSEDRVAATYLAVCDVGGMMGVYAGFSMVTFFQIIGYGIPVMIWFCWKKRNVVQPVMEK